MIAALQKDDETVYFEWAFPPEGNNIVHITARFGDHLGDKRSIKKHMARNYWDDLQKSGFRRV